MKTFDQLREGYASAAQRKAVWASRNDEKEAKKEDSDAVKAFLAKGGKIKKLPPAKAQGYHGKDDPGKDVAGIMDRPDTKQIGTRKKVKSMGEGTIDEASPKQVKMAVGVASDKRYAGGNMTGAVKVIDKIKPGLSKHPQVAAVLKRQNEAKVDEISKKTAGSYVKKASDDMSKQADRMARAQRSDGKMDTAVNKFVNRRRGIARAVNKMATESKNTPPREYDYEGEMAKQQLRIVEMASKELQAMISDDQNLPEWWQSKVTLAADYMQTARDYMKSDVKESKVDELTHDTMNKYYDAAQKSKDKATNSAVATIMRKGDHSKDLKTMAKREKGMKLAKARSIKKIRKIREDKNGSGTDDNYKYNVHGYTGERGDEGHHAMLAKAKARGVKVSTARNQPKQTSSTDGKHIILRGKKKDVDHVIDNHIGRDE